MDVPPAVARPGGAGPYLCREYPRGRPEHGRVCPPPRRARRRLGRIINISTAGAYSFPSEVSCGASKLALEGYTRSAAAELAQFGITVNALALGPIQTGWITPELEKAILPSIPAGRLGTPEDVADAVLLFASEQARWLTGQRVFVGGGHGM